MTQTIELLGGGSAEFSEEYIQINDQKNRRFQRIFIFSSLLWIPTSLMFMAKDDFDFGQVSVQFWLFIFIVGLITKPLLIYRTSFQELVRLDEVASAKVSTGSKDATLTLKLKNGKRRSIQAKYDYAKDFRAYIQANLYQQRR